MTVERHVLGISGGRDSAALAVFMRQTSPDLEIEYFFTDTGKELPSIATNKMVHETAEDSAVRRMASAGNPRGPHRQ